MIDNYGNNVYLVKLVDFDLTSSTYDLKLGLYDTHVNRVVTEHVTFDRTTFDKTSASIDLANRMLEMLRTKGYPVFYFDNVDNDNIAETWVLATAEVISALNATSEQQGVYLLYYPNVESNADITITKSLTSKIFDSTKDSIASKLGLSSTENSSALSIMTFLVLFIFFIAIIIILTSRSE